MYQYIGVNVTSNRHPLHPLQLQQQQQQRIYNQDKENNNQNQYHSGYINSYGVSPLYPLTSFPNPFGSSNNNNIYGILFIFIFYLKYKFEYVYN